jgi:hypothetical protein
MGKREQEILKVVLLLRKVGNRYNTKQQQIAQVTRWLDKGFLTDAMLFEWIGNLEAELEKSGELKPSKREKTETLSETQSGWSAKERGEQYTSCTAGDYSPTHPWDAPGMRVEDFL